MPPKKPKGELMRFIRYETDILKKEHWLQMSVFLSSKFVSFLTILAFYSAFKTSSQRIPKD